MSPDREPTPVDAPRPRLLESVIRWSISNPVIVLLLAGGLIVAGIWAINTTPLDAIPDLSDVQVIVYSQWEGQDPQTIEDQVTYPITTKMLSVPRAKVVRGFSYFGFSLVYVIFEDGVDLYWARSRVLEYLSEIETRLPEGVKAALGPDATGVGWVYQYTVHDTSGQLSLAELRSLQDWYLRYQLTSVPGVSEVASIGGFVDEYQIEVDPNKLLAHDIPLAKVVRAVRRGNQQVGGRILELAETEHMIRGRGYVTSLDDLRQIVVDVDAQGTPVLVGHLARVHRGPAPRRGLAEWDGEGETVGGIVVMRSGENALATIEAVREKLDSLRAGLPEGVEIRTAYDRSGLIRRAVSNLRSTLIEELIVVALVCALFLLHVRSAFVAVLTLPLGLLASFLGMRLFGIGANIMSLGGLAIAIGAMVDASVVLVENAHKHLEEAGGPLGAAERRKLVIRAASEVGPSLFFSLLIVTVSFLPVFSHQGQTGRLFHPLAYTKTFAMAAAALLSVTLMPLAIHLFVRGRIRKESENPINRVLIRGYRPVIVWVLAHPIAVVLGAALLVALATFPAARIGSEFMPPLAEGDVLYMPTTIPGVSIGEARRFLQTQDRLFKTFPEVATVFGKVGRAETATDPAPLSMVETTVRLLPEEDWPARKIREGYVAWIVRDALGRLDAGPELVEGRSEAGVVDDTEKMVLRTLHEEIRIRILDGVPPAQLQEEIRKRLPLVVHDALAGVIRSALVEGGRLPPDLEGAVGEAVEAQSASVPLRPTTFDELMTVDLEQAFAFPGMANAWTMPIKTRLDMLSTGIKTPIGIKVFGGDLAGLQSLALALEKALQDPATRPEGTLSAIADRALGGHYIDFDIDRLACARYGLTIEDVQMVIASAIGGKTVTWTVEGRRRFPVSIRYPRDYRDSIEDLQRVLVATPTGTQVPLGQLARVERRDGPPGIKTENGLYLSVVYVDLAGVDVGSYVAALRPVVDRVVEQFLGARRSAGLPATGYFVEISGQYEQLEEAAEKLRVIGPATLVIILFLLFLNFGRIGPALIVLASIPFAFIGGIWLMYLLGFYRSVAVDVGFIALAGLAAETGVVMLLYLDIAHRRWTAEGPMTRSRLREAIVHGAVMRVRPKIMTVVTTIAGLLPILWATGAGARAMQRMAAPMVGGLISSTVLTLVVIPAVYYLVRAWRLGSDR